MILKAIPKQQNPIDSWWTFSPHQGIKWSSCETFIRLPRLLISVHGIRLCGVFHLGISFKRTYFYLIISQICHRFSHSNHLAFSPTQVCNYIIVPQKYHNWDQNWQLKTLGTGESYPYRQLLPFQYDRGSKPLFCSWGDSYGLRENWVRLLFPRTYYVWNYEGEKSHFSWNHER